MRIEADQEAATIIKSFCDVALKAGGLANMAAVSQVLGNMVVESKKEVLEDEES